MFSGDFMRPLAVQIRQIPRQIHMLYVYPAGTPAGNISIYNALILLGFS